MPSRPSSSRLIASHRSRTRDAVRASASPNTCGCRETSFAWMPRAAASRSPAPRSERSSARKNDWKRRSPTSSSSFASSPPRAASATSYASSTVCGTIVRAVCSRSQGHSRRSRSVSSWSSTRASASGPGAGLGGGVRRRRRRPRIGRRREPDLVLDLLVAAEALREAAHPVGHRLVLLLLLQLLLDRRRDLLLRRRRARMNGRDGLDHEPPVLCVVHRRVNGVRLLGERDLVELRDRLTLRDGELAAVVLRARVLRELLREGAPRLRVAGLQLRVDRVGAALRLDEDVTDVAGLGLRVELGVRDVVVVNLTVVDLHVVRDLLEDRLGDELCADVLAHL